jgi:hypothetical protein
MDPSVPAKRPRRSFIAVLPAEDGDDRRLVQAVAGVAGQEGEGPSGSPPAAAFDGAATASWRGRLQNASITVSHRARPATFEAVAGKQRGVDRVSNRRADHPARRHRP